MMPAGALSPLAVQVTRDPATRSRLAVPVLLLAMDTLDAHEPRVLKVGGMAELFAVERARVRGALRQLVAAGYLGFHGRAACGRGLYVLAPAATAHTALSAL